MPKMAPRGRDNLGRTTAQSQGPKPENDHDYDDHFGDYGCTVVAMSPHRQRSLKPNSVAISAIVAGASASASASARVGISSRCILFLHCNCHLVAVGKAARNNRNYMKWALGECAWTSVFGAGGHWQWLQIAAVSGRTMGHLECRHWRNVAGPAMMQSPSPSQS